MKKNLSILEGVRQEDFLFQSLRLLKNFRFRGFRLLQKTNLSWKFNKEIVLDSRLKIV